MSSVNRWSRAVKLFWKHRATLGKETVKLVGEDQLGNRYFEAHRPNHSRPIQRYFDRPQLKSFEDVADAAHVPPPWEAWLRFRRQEPPTEEEVKDSEEYYKIQQERAARVKAQEQGADSNRS